MLGVYNNASDLAICGETEQEQKQKVIKFWARILKLGDKSFVRLVWVWITVGLERG